LQKTRELVDIETQKVVPFEVLQDEPAYQRIRFMARGVPAVGYRTYHVRDKARARRPRRPPRLRMPRDGLRLNFQHSSPQPDTIENDFYRVRLDAESGAIRSIYDKQLGRELVDESSPYRFGQYVYVTGGDAFPNQMLTYRKTSPVARLDVHKGASGRVVSVEKTPTGSGRASLRAARRTRRASTTEIVLFDDAKKIEINYRVRKERSTRRRASTSPSPSRSRAAFQLRRAERRRQSREGHDSGRGARMVLVAELGLGRRRSSDGRVVNRDSFLWTFGDIVRGTWPKEFARARPRSSHT
jgi:alpha-mannosidase